MNWTETIVESLKNWNTSLIAYVPDISIDQVTSLIDADPFFHLVSATREEEAIGIAVGGYAVGRNSAVFMQSSGFGNSVNALASLCIPYSYGSMGLCSSIALGMALSTQERVISLDGDGSLLMNLGTIATIGREQPKNLIVVVWDNEEWAQTGHQPSHTAMGTDLAQVAQSCGIRRASTVDDLKGLDSAISMALREEGPWFIVAKIQETEYMPVTPIEPELTLYRLRNSFSS